MLFTDAIFFPFLAIVFTGYYLPFMRRWQTRWLLAASLLFYGYNQPWLLLLLMLSGCISIGSARMVMNAHNIAEQRAWAAAGVISNLAVLGFFKYSGFLFASTIGAGAGMSALLQAIPLPIGISFYTFHGISLLIDLLRIGPGIIETSQAEHKANLAERGALYLTFFPQLIAGPIVKAREFFPQIHGHRFSDIAWTGACQALLIGYFLKSVIADNLQEQTFWMAYPYFVGLSSFNLVVLMIGYSIQIFSDFAGYSLIAIGLARLFGYELPENFRFPYIAESFSEFWTRWHISLSTWLREYLYIPLGGNRKGPLRTYANLMIVMFLGGLWHGAAWSYAAWGVWHGAALALERMAANTWFYRTQVMAMRALRMALVFGFVTAAWLLFKLPNFAEVQAYLGAIRDNFHIKPSLGGPMMIALYALPVILYHLHHLLRRGRDQTTSSLRPLVYGAMLVMIAINSGPGAAFIYFQF